MVSGQWVVRDRAWNSNRPEPKRPCHVIPAQAGIQRGWAGCRRGRPTGRVSPSSPSPRPSPSRGERVGIEPWHSSNTDPQRLCCVIPAQAGIQREGSFLIGRRCGGGVSGLPLSDPLPSPPPEGEGIRSLLGMTCKTSRGSFRYGSIVRQVRGFRGKGVFALPLLPSYPLPLWGRVRERGPRPDDST